MDIPANPLPKQKQIPAVRKETTGWVNVYDCAHRTRSEMIANAWKFLTEHIGDTVDDPGYF